VATQNVKDLIRGSLIAGFDLADSALGFATARLDCEPLAPRHAGVLFEGQADSALYRFIPHDPLSEEQLRRRFELLATRRSQDGKQLWLNWALHARAANAYVGSLQATVFPDARAAIAYSVFSSYQRCGFAREACDGLLSFLAERGVREATADIDTRNRASIALVESLGFVRERETKNADFFKGATSDEYRYRRSLK